jgi:predicted HicB family RNase H-like nuclease
VEVSIIMKKKFTTTLDESIVKAMKIQAIEEGISVSALIEKMFKIYTKD